MSDRMELWGTEVGRNLSKKRWYIPLAVLAVLAVAEKLWWLL